MKKFLICLMIIILFSNSLCGCSNTIFISFESKPSAHYYSDEVMKILNSGTYTVKVLDMNMYKEETVKDNEKNIILDFLNHVDKNKNYISQPKDISDKNIQYKIFVEGNGQKYVINVYNDKYVCLHPWDGTFTEDFITSDNVPINYNLCGFCRYMFKPYD